MRMKVFVVARILLYVSQHALAVEVFDGMESVQLPCKVNVSVSMESTVVWSREDLRFSVVHIHQQSGDDLSEQNQRYSDRTMMKRDALRTGDLSLTLKNPAVSDSETYTCIVRRFGQELSRIHVQLQVKERPHPVWIIPLSVVLVLLVVLATVFGSVIYWRYKRIKRDPVYKLQVVKTAEGEDHVVLPCKTKAHLSRKATVEWRRIDTDEVVYQYPSSQQQQVGRARGLQMEENLVRTGDLSLTLNNPSHYDSGLYVCTVEKGGHNLKQKVVSLSVQEHPNLWTEMHFDDSDEADCIESIHNTPDRTSLRHSLKSSFGQFWNRSGSRCNEFYFEDNSQPYGSYKEDMGEDELHMYNYHEYPYSD